MRFAPVPIADALGAVLGHNVADADGRRILRKGKTLEAGDLERLRSLGRQTVHVAIIDPDDVDEDTAATRIATAVAAGGLRPSAARTGRVNLYADVLGVLDVDLVALRRLNALPGVTLATARRHAPVQTGRIVATLKVIPYALPADLVCRAEAVASGVKVLHVAPLRSRRVGLILSGSPGAEARVTHSFRDALEQRLTAWGSTLVGLAYVSLEHDDAEHALAEAIRSRVAAGDELLVLAGETAIMDRDDIVPRALERAGGSVVAYGAPVDPGNLLLLGRHGDVPVVGAPGCARSPKTNVIDLVLPRLLAGKTFDAEDLAELGHGGLLEDVPERRLPRSWVG